MRLLVPLVFGMLVVAPPQIYMERLFRGEQVGSFLQFWPTVLELKPYPAGNTSWHHLWFVAYLLMYSVAALPFFRWWRSERAATARIVVERFLAGAGIYLLGVPLVLVLAALALYCTAAASCCCRVGSGTGCRSCRADLVWIARISQGALVTSIRTIPVPASHCISCANFHVVYGPLQSLPLWTRSSVIASSL
jgi:hypothetical protein